VGIGHPTTTIYKDAGGLGFMGSGASLGPEGPSVEMARISAYCWGRCCSFSRATALALGAGAAAGLAAGFNAPIAGVFFARGGTRNHVCHFSSVVVLAAVVAALVAQIGLGTQPAFTGLRSPQSVGISFVYGIGSVCQFGLYYLYPVAPGSESLLFGCVPGFTWLEYRQLFIL